MPDEYFSDGAMEHNYPGRIAKPEARALWPRNSEPIFLTAGCGDYTDSHYQGRNTWFDRSCFNRLHRWHMKSINADHQYKEHRGNSTGFNRLDIYMNIQKPELDQIEALPLICSTAAISGFPNSAYNVWEIQEDWHRGQKRKLEYESDTISSKKPRM